MVFIVLFCCIFFFISNLNEVTCIKAETFKIRVISLSDCALPKSDYDEGNYVPHYMSVYKVDRTTTKIRANFTIDHKFGPITTVIRSYEKGNKVADNKNIPCSHIIVQSIKTMLKLNSTSDCYVLPGKYSFDDFDVEQLRYFMVYVWRVGRYAYEIEFRTPLGVVTCIHILLDFSKEYKAVLKKRPLII